MRLRTHVWIPSPSTSEQTMRVRELPPLPVFHSDLRRKSLNHPSSDSRNHSLQLDSETRLLHQQGKCIVISSYSCQTQERGASKIWGTPPRVISTGRIYKSHAPPHQSSASTSLAPAKLSAGSTPLCPSALFKSRMCVLIHAVKASFCALLSLLVQMYTLQAIRDNGPFS
jgi:hypothetical protein